MTHSNFHPFQALLEDYYQAINLPADSRSRPDEVPTTTLVDLSKVAAVAFFSEEEQKEGRGNTALAMMAGGKFNLALMDPVEDIKMVLTKWSSKPLVSCKLFRVMEGYRDWVDLYLFPHACDALSETEIPGHDHLGTCFHLSGEMKLIIDLPYKELTKWT